MIVPNAHVPAPDLALTDGTPVSQAFGDVYFSRDGGVEETTHVFLRGNGLPERWCAPPSNQAITVSFGHSLPLRGRDGVGALQGTVPDYAPLLTSPRWGEEPPCGEADALHKPFTIGELGFGTGLNFLVTWKRWKETAPAGAVLQYISIEKYPFRLADLRAILALQPEVAEEAAALLAAYPLRLPGIHRIHLPGAVLTLCFGDAAAMLGEWDAPVDAWFLDGFSPAKNPAMWSDDVLSQLGRLSAPGTTFATFTSAGAVRRSLTAAGFAVSKVPGYGHKREMSVGVREDSAYGGCPPGVNVTKHPAALRPHPDFLSAGALENPTSPAGRGSPAAPFVPAKTILILGAGIAGATLARALAERGVNVTVLESAEVGAGASGNPAGVLFPQLSKRWNVSTGWYFTAYGFMLRQLVRWRAEGMSFAGERAGMLRLPRHAEEEAQLRSLQQTLGLDDDIVHWLERDAASEQAGVALKTGGAFFPEGRWISPPELCRALLQHANIACCTGTAAKTIRKTMEGWQVTLGNGDVMQADVLCVATAQESAALLADYGITLNAVGGQVSDIAAPDGTGELRTILCHKGYIIPLGGHYLIGATYHRDGDMLAVTDAHHAENLAELETVLPGWGAGSVIRGRSALRATTPDRLPYIGRLDDGLYVSTGHGSRGLLSAPLGAEMIASDICGEQRPVSRALQAAVDPLRFRHK